MRVALLLALLVAAAAADRPEIEIVGNHGVSARTLKAAARRDLADYAKDRHPGGLHDAAWAMEAALRARGYPDARVSFTAEPDAAAATSVRFVVAQGPRAVIDDVRIDGVGRRDADLDRGLITGRKGFLDFGRPPYVASDIDGALKKIERRYLLLGFYRVRVRLAATRWNRGRTRADLRVVVDRGPLYHVREATVDLTPGADPPAGFAERARQVAAGLAGKPYRARVGEEAAAELRGWLRDRGRLHAEVTTDSAIDEAAATATIRLRVDPATTVRVRGVEIDTGPGRTKAGFVRGVLGVKEGSEWNQARVDEGVRSIYRAGVFSKVEATPVDVPGDPHAADLRVALEEAQTKEFDVEAGWGSYEMLRGAIRYRDKHLFGRGRFGEVGVEASMRSWGGDVTFRDPYSFGPHNVFSLTPYYLFREEPSYDRNEIGARAAVTHRIQDTRFFLTPTDATIGNRYRATRASRIVGPIPAVESRDFIQVSEIFGDLAWDHRDSRVLPEDGFVVDLETAVSDPLLGADLSFVEVGGSVRAYTALSRRIVGAVGLRYRTRIITDGATSLPIQERLFLGGDSTVRSFGKDELGPTDAEGDPVGGLTLALATVEARIRLVGHLHGAVFYDVGAIGEDAWSVAGPPGQAIGGGLRYYLPIGPIRVDAGWNPGERFAANRPWAVHASIGFSF